MTFFYTVGLYLPPKTINNEAAYTFYTWTLHLLVLNGQDLSFDLQSLDVVSSRVNNDVIETGKMSSSLIVR